MRYKFLIIIFFIFISFYISAQTNSAKNINVIPDGIPKNGTTEITSATSSKNILWEKDDSLSSVSYICVHTLPVASDIFIDSTYAGKSPLDSFSISPGLHKINIKHKGYKDLIRHFFVKPGSNDFKGIVLRPDFGFISLNPHPSDSKIIVDSSLIYLGSISTLKLTAGYHSITVTHPGEKNIITERVFVYPGKHSEIVVPLNGFSFRAAFFSAVVPGLGQVLDGSYLKGTSEFLGTLGLGYLTYTFSQERNRKKQDFDFALFRYKLASTESGAIYARKELSEKAANLKAAKDKVTFSIIGIGTVYLLNLVDALIFHSTEKRFRFENNIDIPYENLENYGNDISLGMEVKIGF